MVKYLLVNAFVFLTFLTIAQTDNKDVVITSSGSGTTQEQAKQTALRNAIEQAFGAFISSKTEIFNDEIVADQMSSVSSGNIKSYEVLNESQLPNGTWASTLRVIVSVDKLTSFVEAKGISVEIKGGLFALNIKQQLLNEQGEINAIAEMVGVLHEPMQTAFDYTIKSGDPKSLDAESKNWEIPLTVTATGNRNMDFCANYFIKTLSAISLTQAEVETYKSLNKEIYPILINYQGISKRYFLRKKQSENAISFLVDSWKFYLQLFKVNSGIDEIIGIGKEGKIHDIGGWREDSYPGQFKDHYIIHFLSSGIEAAQFNWQDTRTLKQIERMTSYKVDPVGVVSNYKNGGVVVKQSFPGGYRIGATPDNNAIINYLAKDFPAINSGVKIGDKLLSINGQKYLRIEQFSENMSDRKPIILDLEREGQKVSIEIIPKYIEPSKGFVLAIASHMESQEEWNIANSACEEFVLNGYDDWRLPTKEEYFYLEKYLYKNGIGGLAGSYWGTKCAELGAWGMSFENKWIDCDHVKNSHWLLPVRSFD